MSANGQLLASELAPVATFPGNKLRRGGAASGMNTLNLKLYHRTGVGRYTSNGSMSDYRVLWQQRQLRAEWCARGRCGNAAYPGTSNHGLAIASDGQRWKLVAYGGVYGWGPCTDAPWESWHTKWCGNYTRPDPGPNVLYPVMRSGSGGPEQHLWVRRIQRALRELGWHVEADGDYGGRTVTAIHQFQDAVGFKRPTGVTAKGTWVALRRALALKRAGRRWRR